MGDTIKNFVENHTVMGLSMKIGKKVGKRVEKNINKAVNYAKDVYAEAKKAPKKELPTTAHYTAPLFTLVYENSGKIKAGTKKVANDIDVAIKENSMEYTVLGLLGGTLATQLSK